MPKGIYVVALLSLGLALQATDAGATSTSKSERGRVKVLEAKTQRLERRVARQRRHLRRLRTEVRALRGQLEARPPSALAKAVEQVRREVAYVELYRANGVRLPSREELVARSAMDYVVGHVTAPGYGYLNKIRGPRPAATAESVLQAGSGICGHASLTFAAIVKRLGLPVRSVQFYYAKGNSHIAVEVYYGGAWHYFDPTWGAYYQEGSRVLSIGEARTRADARALLHQDSTLFWRWVVTTAGGEPLGRETDAATRVEIGKQPFPAQ